MTDEEIRGKLLKHCFDLRNANDGSVGVDDIIFAPAVVTRQAIALAAEHMDEVRWIKWTPFTGANQGHLIGRAKILGYGVDVVMGKRAPDIAIRLPNVGQDAPAAVASATLQAAAKSIEPEPSAQAPAKPTELFTLKPALWGMSIDLKELWRRISAWRARAI